MFRTMLEAKKLNAYSTHVTRRYLMPR